MQKRKRAPGAGRKPQGEFSGKAAKLTMRITCATRKELEVYSKESGLSLSQGAEHHLRLSLSRVRIRDHVQALAEIITLLAERIESQTTKKWNEDVFTSEALRRGIEFLLSHFGPRGTPVTPVNVKEAAAQMVGDAGKAYRSPVGLGETEAGQVMAWIEISKFRDLQEIVRADAELRKKGKQSTGGIRNIQFPKKWHLHRGIFDELSPSGKHAQEK
jgi:hypothetical protein